MTKHLFYCLLNLLFPMVLIAQQDAGISDSALLDTVERQTLRYFWEGAGKISGLVSDRNNGVIFGKETMTTGGSGFAVMAIIAGVQRKWINRDLAVDRLVKMLIFLQKADSYHGLFPHLLNGITGKTIPFSRKDDGADVVETSYLLAGLLCARQYFNGDNPMERELRDRVNSLWREAEWNWQAPPGKDTLYWHWSPNNGFSMNAPINGWNECLITYVLAASSPTYPIDTGLYHRCWARGKVFRNGRTYFGIPLSLGPDYGGPLFFAHYSFLGLDPHGLKDKYADYWIQNVNHTLINREYCIRNPKNYAGYGPDCWGLTASDGYNGYSAYAPGHDFGVIAPTAALSSFPYTPAYSMQALRYFYSKLKDKIWGEYGFTDAFCESCNWYDESYLAIDEGPIVVMIENYRSGLLWRLFMSCPEIKEGLRKLGFESPWMRK
jgi:hypothetical protein